MVGFETAATSDTITLNGTTTGGVTFAKVTNVLLLLQVNGKLT